MRSKTHFLFNIILIFLYLILHPLSIKAMDLVEVPTEMHLTKSLVKALTPGIYESDDIDLILSFANENFTGGDRDIIVFDVDQVLITARVNPFVLIPQKTSTFFEGISSQERYIRDKFLLYLYASESPHTIALMDQRTPLLIKELQSKGVRCMGNTAMDPVLGLTDNFDMARARIKLLRDLGIDFSETFLDFSEWNFDSLDRAHVKNCPPLFKDGIIFSSLVPKYVTQVHFLKKLESSVRRIVFIDDNINHLHGMYKSMTILGIQCYCFCYNKKKVTPLIEYFLPTILNEEFEHLENVLQKILQGECANELFLSAYLREFIIHLRAEKGWRIWK